MKKYYIIPINDKDVLLDNKISLYDYLDFYFPSLRAMYDERNRIFLQYLKNINSMDTLSMYYEYDKKIEDFCNEMILPRFLFAVGYKYGVKEKYTDIKLQHCNIDIFSRIMSEKKFNNFYNDDYIEKVKRFFDPSLIKNIQELKPIINFEERKERILKRRK